MVKNALKLVQWCDYLIINDILKFQNLISFLFLSDTCFIPKLSNSEQKKSKKVNTPKIKQYMI